LKIKKRKEKEMKKRILFFFALVLCFTNTSFSQGLSDAFLTGTGSGTGVTFIDPHTGNSRNVSALLIIGTVDGDSTQFYCVDIQEL
jgi:hypothetical protein